MEAVEKVKLIMAKVEILKLKANNYEWQCYVPKDVKEELEKSLAEISLLLAEDK